AGIYAKLVEGIGRIRCTGETALGGRRGDPNQLLRIRKRKRLQQNGVHYAEYGDVGADGEGQDEHRDGGETAIAPQSAQCVTDVLPQNVKCHKPSRLPMSFPGLLNSADADE